MGSGPRVLTTEMDVWGLGSEQQPESEQQPSGATLMSRSSNLIALPCTRLTPMNSHTNLSKPRTPQKPYVVEGER